jgi:hypothetical protein
MSIVEAFKKTITFFNEMQKEGHITDYALIGGLALSSWVRPRTTRDVDLLVTVSKKLNWSDVASHVEARLNKKVILQRGTRRTAIQERLGQVEVDVIGTKDFELAAEAIEHAVPVQIFDKNIKVASPEYLILLKLLPLSSQDEIDIRALMKKADIKRLATLAEKHHLLPKLESMQKKPKKLK